MQFEYSFRKLFVIPQIMGLGVLKNVVSQMLQYYAVSFEKLDSIGLQGWLVKFINCFVLK